MIGLDLDPQIDQILDEKKPRLQIISLDQGDLRSKQQILRLSRALVVLYSKYHRMLLTVNDQLTS